MFHNHATPRRIYITADTLRLNKLLQSTTHVCRAKLLSHQQRLTSASAPQLRQMLLAALVSSQSSALEAARDLPHASVAKRRSMQVTE
jgi:hypothetical protein